MRLLTGMGLFTEVGHDAFVPTPLAGIYVSGSPLTEAVVHMCVNLIVAVSIVWLSFDCQNLTNQGAIQAFRLFEANRISKS